MKPTEIEHRTISSAPVFEVNWGDGWRPCIAQMHAETFKLVADGYVRAAINKAIEVHIANYGQHPVHGEDPKYRCGMRIVESIVTTCTLVEKQETSR